MTKEQFNDLLYRSLNSDIWQSVKNSLIGRELIAYGAEVLYQNELVKKSLVESFQPNNMDLQGLINFANNTDLKISDIRPAYVKIKINEVGKVYQPFSVRLQIGSIIFTNITFCSSNEEITLYQGKVMGTYSKSTLTTNDFYSFKIDNTIPWNEHVQYLDNTNQSKYIKLTTKVKPDSVYVFSKSNLLVKILSEFNPIAASLTAQLYKVNMLEDKTQTVMFGNHIWSEGLNTSTQEYQIVWLDLTTEDFNTTNAILYVGSEQKNYTLLASFAGKQEDLSYAKEYIDAQLSEQNAIITTDQVAKAVKGNPTVQDCLIKPDPSTNKLTIFIKPTVFGDNYFSDIELLMNQKGDPMAHFEVKPGVPYLFNILLNYSDYLSQNGKAAIKSFLEEKYKYSALKYKSQVSSHQIESEVKTMYEVDLESQLEIKEPYSLQLTFPPNQNTLKIYDDSKVIGYETNGLLYKNVEENLGVYDAVGAGDMILYRTQGYAGGYSDLIAYDTTLGVSKDITEILTDLKDLKIMNVCKGANNNIISFIGSKLGDENKIHIVIYNDMGIFNSSSTVNCIKSISPINSYKTFSFEWNKFTNSSNTVKINIPWKSINVLHNSNFIGNIAVMTTYTYLNTTGNWYYLTTTRWQFRNQSDFRSGTITEDEIDHAPGEKFGFIAEDMSKSPYENLHTINDTSDEGVMSFCKGHTGVIYTSIYSYRAGEPGTAEFPIKVKESNVDIATILTNLKTVEYTNNIIIQYEMNGQNKFAVLERPSMYVEFIGDIPFGAEYNDEFRYASDCALNINKTLPIFTDISIAAEAEVSILSISTIGNYFIFSSNDVQVYTISDSKTEIALSPGKVTKSVNVGYVDFTTGELVLTEQYSTAVQVRYTTNKVSFKKDSDYYPKLEEIIWQD